MDYSFTLALLPLALAIGIDNFAVAFAYGLNGTRIPFFSAIIIIGTSIAMLAISILAGSALSSLISPIVGEIIGIAIMSFILFILVRGIVSSPKPKPKLRGRPPKKPRNHTIKEALHNPLLSDMDRSRSISSFEAIILTVAINIDSVGMGFGYSLANPVPLTGVLVIGLVQLLMFATGNFSGVFIRTRKLKSGEYLRLLSCVIILGLIMWKVAGLVR